MTVFLCEDSFEGMLTGVYDAWASRLGHDHVRLELIYESETEFFTEYREVPPDPVKAGKVMDSVKRKISVEAYEMIYKASLSCEHDRADRIYRFLIDGYQHGGKVVQMLSRDSVFRIFEVCRYISNETHLLTGFVRFACQESGALISKITPKNRVLPLLAPHFADRLPSENWMIYDAGRREAVFHPAEGAWVFATLNREQAAEADRIAGTKDEYRDLWKIFFKTIAIKERTNPVCQRNHLPNRYRGNMPEFDKG